MNAKGASNRIQPTTSTYAKLWTTDQTSSTTGYYLSGFYTDTENFIAS